MTKKPWPCHICDVTCQKHWTYCNGCNKTKQEIRADAAAIDSKKQKEAAAAKKAKKDKDAKDAADKDKAKDKDKDKDKDKSKATTSPDDDDSKDVDDTSLVDEVLIELKEKEAILMATIASLTNIDGKQAADQKSSWEQELIQVRHAITGRQPAKDQIAKLTHALSNAEDKNVKIKKKIDDATKNLAEAVQAIEDLERKRNLNVAQIADVKTKLAVAKQAYACEQAASSTAGDPAMMVMTGLASMAQHTQSMPPEMQQMFHQMFVIMQNMTSMQASANPMNQSSPPTTPIAMTRPTQYSPTQPQQQQQMPPQQQQQQQQQVPQQQQSPPQQQAAPAMRTMHIPTFGPRLVPTMNFEPPVQKKADVEQAIPMPSFTATTAPTKPMKPFGKPSLHKASKQSVPTDAAAMPAPVWNAPGTAGTAPAAAPVAASPPTAATADDDPDQGLGIDQSAAGNGVSADPYLQPQQAADEEQPPHPSNDCDGINSDVHERREKQFKKTTDPNIQKQARTAAVCAQTKSTREQMMAARRSTAQASTDVPVDAPVDGQQGDTDDNPANDPSHPNHAAYLMAKAMNHLNGYQDGFSQVITCDSDDDDELIPDTMQDLPADEQVFRVASSATPTL